MNKTYFVKVQNSGWYSNDFTAKTLRAAKIMASKLCNESKFALYEKYGANSETVAIKENGKWSNI